MQRDSFTSTRSMSFALGDGPANALALSKDNGQVVVAGRNVFKILSIEEDAFVEKLNLRVGKNLNLNYSCNDVVWSHLEENYIATGATNGAVVVWNLSKNTRAKQEHVFADHQRTVHRVIFHPTDPNMLLSGSQDGTVKSFDIRSKEARLTFQSNSESVRDIQFLPKTTFSFTSVTENGSVQLWDVRRADRPFLVFTAHSGPVFSCDWHPETPNVLATGGRDRAIKVWTVTNLAVLEHTIQTLASVGRVKWRPSRKNHIGSTSLVVDASVCVWDVRRPFVPFAAFEKHKDVVTGMAWKSSPHIFVSTSKDCTVWQHVFKDASRPAAKAIPQALALNARGGEIAQAITTYQHQSNDSSPKYQSPVLKRTSFIDEHFHLAESHFFTFESFKLLRQGINVPCAKEYVVNGKSALEMCERNGKLALQHNLEPAGLVWDIARHYCLTMTTHSNKGTVKELKLGKTLLPPVDKCSLLGPSMSIKEDKNDEGKNLSDIEDGNNNYQNNSSSETERQDLLGDIASGLSGLHMTPNLFMASAPTYDFQVQQDWPVLPEEAFQHRHEIKEGSSPPLHLQDCSSRDVEEPLATVAIENRTSHLRISRMEQYMAPLDLTRPLLNALHFHASAGDVQTAVCVWLSLAPLIKLNVDSKVLELWCHGYVDLLQRHRLFTEAATIVKHCAVIGHLSQESTSFLVCCGRCGKPLNQKSGNYCDKCRKAVARCAICHGTVSGLISWCQGCGHGGHVGHLSTWFLKHKECPVGCGHLCHS